MNIFLLNRDGFFGAGVLIARCVFVATKPKNNLAQTLKFLERKSSQLGFLNIRKWKTERTWLRLG